MGDDSEVIVATNGGGGQIVSKTDKATSNGVNHNNHHNGHQNGGNHHPQVKENGNAPAAVEFKPPDGGVRAWTILISAFLCNGIIFGIINVYGTIYLHLQEQMKINGDDGASSKAALVGSLTIGATFFLSPVSGILVDMIGIRKTTAIGGILCAGGMFISSYFTSNVTALYFTYGIMFGAGSALAYTPTLAILGHYFKKYMGVASGIVTAGSSVFTVVLPNFLDYLIKNTDLSRTFQIVALMTSFVIVCGVLYKPLQPPAPRPVKKASRSKAHNLARSLINFDNWKKKKYVIWASSIPIALFGYFVPYVHMGKFVKVNFPGEDHNMPVMMIGISSCIGRLLFGYIADFPHINRIYLQQAAFTMMGLMTMLLPATNSFVLLCIFSFSMGLFDGCFISLLGPIAYDICGQHGATQAIGFLLGLCSLPLTVGPPLAGMLFDQMGSYTLPFVVAGIPPIIGALCMTAIQFVKDDSCTAVADTNHAAQNGWVDPENLMETKLFLPKTTPITAPEVVARLTSEPKQILASAGTVVDKVPNAKSPLLVSGSFVVVHKFGTFIHPQSLRHCCTH